MKDETDTFDITHILMQRIFKKPTEFFIIREENEIFLFLYTITLCFYLTFHCFKNRNIEMNHRT